MNSIFSLSGLSILLTCSILIFVIFNSGKTKLHKTWMFFNIAVAIWGLGSFFIGNSKSSYEAIFWWRIAHIGIILLPVFMFHVVSILCELDRKKLLIFIYLQGFLFLFFDILNPNGIFLSGTRQLASSFYYGTLGPLYHPFFALWLLIVFLSHYELFLSYFRLQGIKRTQIAYLLFATVIGFLGGLTNFIPAYGIDIFPYGNFTIPLYCIIVTYAILRYRLMDINLVIKKTLVYSLSAGVLTSIFVVIVLSMTTYLSEFTGITSFWITVVAALIIAFLFTPLKDKIQTFIDKLFYKTTYDYYATIQNASHHLASSFDKKEIYQYIVDTVFTTLKLRNAYLLSEENRDFEITYARSSKFPFGVGSTGEVMKIKKGSEITDLLEVQKN
jgi:hypothetical protein